LSETPGLRSDDVPDIEIAALAIEHGLVLASHDHGFRRLVRLRTVDPLS
jgi:predicted nucleic acid-binding protein